MPLGRELHQVPLLLKGFLKTSLAHTQNDNVDDRQRQKPGVWRIDVAGVSSTRIKQVLGNPLTSLRFASFNVSYSCDRTTGPMMGPGRTVKVLTEFYPDQWVGVLRRSIFHLLVKKGKSFCDSGEREREIAKAVGSTGQIGRIKNHLLLSILCGVGSFWMRHLINHRILFANAQILMM